MDQQDESKIAFNHAAEEIRFFKNQQWQITNYALLLQAAMVGALTLIEDAQRVALRPCLTVLSIVVAVISVILLLTFQSSISKERGRMEEARSALPHLQEIHKRKLSDCVRLAPLVVLIFVNVIAACLAVLVMPLLKL